MKKKLVWPIVFTIATVAYTCVMVSLWPQEKGNHSGQQGTSLTTEEGTKSSKTDGDAPNGLRRRSKEKPSGPTTPRGNPLPTYAFFIQRPWETCDSVLQVNTRPGSAYVLKVVDPWTGQTILSCYFPGGTTREIEVPSGTYEIRYATGSEWFDNVNLFGPSGHYAKAKGRFNFSEDSGYELTLYSVPHGNLGTTSIRPQDF